MILAFRALDLFFQSQQPGFLDQVTPANDFAGLHGQQLAVGLAFDKQPADVLQGKNNVAALVADKRGRQGSTNHHHNAGARHEAHIIVG